MKKFLFFNLSLLCFLLFSNNLFAQNFYGWWKCLSGGSEIGDFVTGEWMYEKVTHNKGSYLYVGNNGIAYLIQCSDQGFYLENEFSFFERNNILVLRGPYSSDDDGNLLSSSTGIIKTSLPHPYPNKITMAYTRYDLENLYVKRFNLTFTRVRNIQYVPEEVKRLIP